MEYTSIKTMNFTNLTHAELLGYNAIHKYIVTPLCFFGIVTNVLNFVTWWRQKRKTAVTFTLRILSLVDLLVAASYLPVALYIFIITQKMKDICHSKGIMWLMLVCNHLFVIMCTWSVWITLLVATVRCINVSLSRQGFSIPKTRKISILLFFLFQLEAVPYYLFYKVKNVSATNDSCATYWIVRTELAMKSEFYHDFLFTLLALTRGIIPCVLFLVLCFITIYLIVKRRCSRAQVDTEISDSDFRTTIMLFVMALLFFLCMVPIIVHPIVLLGRSKAKAQYFWFLDSNYMILNANFLGNLQISHCSFNIIIYIVMCKTFRTSLKEIVCCCHQPGYTRIPENQDGEVRRQNYQGAQEPVTNTTINLVY